MEARAGKEAVKSAAKYFAHTATLPDGKPDPDPDHWQLLSTHLRNVAQLAKQFATPLGLGSEAELAGLLHDLGKYAERFQARLRSPTTIRGINHWAAGAVHGAEARQHCVAFAVDGHHTGMPSRDGDGLKQTIARMRSDSDRESFSKCPEPVSELLRRFDADGLRLPALLARRPAEPFAEALRTRLIFSGLVDADFLDTEQHFDPAAAACRDVPSLQPQRALQMLTTHLAGLASEEQGRFALGYYCQLAQYRKDRAEDEAARKAEELADAAD